MWKCIQQVQEIQTRCFGEKCEENPQGSFKDTTAYRANGGKTNLPLVVYGEEGN